MDGVGKYFVEGKQTQPRNQACLLNGPNMF